MVWVRSEYAGELAVVSAWLAALLPWNVTYTSDEGLGGLLYIRFVFAEFVYFRELEVGGRSFELLSIHRAVSQQLGQDVEIAYFAWVAGAVLVGAAVCLSITYYFREERVENAPVDPVTTMGVLLVGAGIAFLLATYLVVTRGIPGIPIPIGTVVLLVLGGVLIGAERVGDEPDGSVENGEASG